MPNGIGFKGINNEVTWPKELPTYLDGRIDLEKFEKIFSYFAKAKYPAIFFLNQGTTVTHAFD